MRHIDIKTARSVFLICLPALVTIAAGVYFLVCEVPEIVRGEEKRVLSEYRQHALELKDNPSSGVEKPRGKGGVWTSAGKMAPGRWGYGAIGGGRALVWYSPGRNRHAVVKEIPEITRRNYAKLFYISVPVAMAVVIFLAAAGVRYFIVYIRSRDDFLAACAHDLATPLVGMRYTIGADDEAARMLNERMMRIVGNIRDFLRLGGRRPKPAAEAFNLVDAYDEAYALFKDDYRDVFDGKDVEISLSGTAREKFSVRGDATTTVQIFWNLLGNDLKYAAPYGGVKAVFSIDRGNAVFSLVDCGKGMSKKEMSRAFDRYYRAKNVLETGKGGFGIGLCTAREFAEAMGGSLTVEANNPKGCIFRLSLPCFA